MQRRENVLDHAGRRTWKQEALIMCKWTFWPWTSENLKIPYFKERGRGTIQILIFEAKQHELSLGEDHVQFCKKKSSMLVNETFFFMLQHCILNDCCIWNDCLWNTKHWRYLLAPTPFSVQQDADEPLRTFRGRQNTVIKRVNTFLQFCNRDLPCLSS